MTAIAPYPRGATHPGQWLKLKEETGAADTKATFILPLVVYSDFRGLMASGMIVIRHFKDDSCVLAVLLGTDASEPNELGGIWGDGLTAVTEFPKIVDGFIAADDIQWALRTDRPRPLTSSYSSPADREEVRSVIERLRELTFPKPHTVGAMLGRRR